MLEALCNAARADSAVRQMLSIPVLTRELLPSVASALHGRIAQYATAVQQATDNDVVGCVPDGQQSSECKAKVGLIIRLPVVGDRPC